MRLTHTIRLHRTGARRAAPLLAAVVCAACSLSTASADTIATWTFETTAPVSSGTNIGPLAAELGSGSASGVHASAATAWSSPAGNGSTHSFSSNNWAAGDYYQFAVSTLGEQNVAITWDQASSGTGPRDYNLSYSTDGTNFTQVGNTYSVLVNGAPNTPWTSTGSPNLAFNYVSDLPTIGAINNASSVYFRLAMTGTVSANGGAIGTSGTDRVDNFTVTAAPVPEPASLVLAGLAASALALTAIRRRGRRYSATV